MNYLEAKSKWESVHDLQELRLTEYASIIGAFEKRILELEANGLKEKIKLLLDVTRERLRDASVEPIDFAAGVEALAQISVLELLNIYAESDSK